MDIDTYLAKYAPGWRWLEAATARGSASLVGLPGERIDDVIRAYLRASTQLAEVRTRYSDPGLERYLSGVVAQAHGAIYAVRPRTFRGFLSLFGARYRAALRRTLPGILAMAVLLLVVGVLVWAWTVTSREARAGLLPPWVDESIRRHTRGGGVVDAPASLMTTQIFLNNVQVAVLAFAFGITFGLGTIWVVANNALLIASLAGAFHAADLAWRFWSLVLPHGFLELTAICIAAGAGFRIGWSLVAPGDLSRSAALAATARDALLVIVGVVPAFLLAAVIEGFVTGRTGLPWLEVAIGAVVAVAYALWLWGRVPGRGRPALTAAHTP